jgi:hypothetical protein
VNETTFRSLLREQLTDVIAAEVIDQNFVQMAFAEDQRDVVGEFLDYYTAELLAFESFRIEFSATEIEAIQQFIEKLGATCRAGLNWNDVRAEAKFLSEFLTSGH